MEECKDEGKKAAKCKILAEYKIQMVIFQRSTFLAEPYVQRKLQQQEDDKGEWSKNKLRPQALDSFFSSSLSRKTGWKDKVEI